MADLPKCPDGIWTVGALHAHLEALMEAKGKADEQRFTAQETASRVAFMAAKEKADAHNDLIGANERALETMMPRVEYAIQHQALIDRIARAEDRGALFIPREEASLQHGAIYDRLDRLEERLKAAEIEQLKASAERAGVKMTMVRFNTLVLTMVTVLGFLFIVFDRIR
jgi:hypothetical protein